MAVISADRYNNLKARVKAECNRRRYTGSVSSYGGTEYDYTITPASGGIIRTEHRDKIATPLNAINSDNVPLATGQNVISDNYITVMESFTTVLEARSQTDRNGTDCKSSCTGLCYGCTGTGYNGCSGCGGSCSYDCTGSCSGGCSTTCRGSCKGSCETGCSGGCSDTCKGSCETGCSGGCYNACGQTCTAGSRW